MRRLSADAWIMIGLGVVALLLVVVLSRGAGGAPGGGGWDYLPHRSTFNSRPAGTRALYLTLQELGYPAERFRYRFTELEGPGTLVIAEPKAQIPISAAEWRAVLAWVAEGNLLFLATETGETFGTETTAPPLLRGFDRDVPPWDAEPVYPAPARETAPQLRGRSRLRLHDAEWFPPVESRGGAAGPEEDGIPLVPLYGDAAGPVLAYGRHGEGNLLLLASPWSLANEGIAEGNNFPLFLRLVEEYGPGKEGALWFDEYHHGYALRSGVIQLVPAPARAGLAHLALALLLLLLAAAWRFGAPRLLPELERRSRGEYITSMAGLYQRVRAWDVVFHRLRELTARELTRSLGLPPGSSKEEIARAAKLRRGMDEREVLAALSEAERLAGTPVSRELSGSQALALARRLAALRRNGRQ